MIDIEKRWLIYMRLRKYDSWKELGHPSKRADIQYSKDRDRQGALLLSTVALILEEPLLKDKRASALPLHIEHSFVRIPRLVADQWVC